MSCEVEDRTYTFDQLSDKAKRRARDKWRETALHDEWWDHVYEDAIAMGKLLGLHIGDWSSSTHAGKTYTKPDIWFSGFCSQGDGCCWSGQVHVAELAGAVARVTSEVGQDDDLLELARVAEQLYAEVAAIAAVNRLVADDVNRDWPNVAVDMKLTVVGKERSYSTSIDDPDFPSGEPIDKLACEFVSGFADWIYTQLENEHDYQLSDEVIDEAIDNACLSFDEDGNEL